MDKKDYKRKRNDNDNKNNDLNEINSLKKRKNSHHNNEINDKSSHNDTHSNHNSKYNQHQRSSHHDNDSHHRRHSHSKYSPSKDSKYHDHHRKRSRERSRERSRDRSKSHHNDKSRDKSRHSDRDRSRHSDRDRSRHSDRDRSRHSDRDKSRHSDRDRSRNRSNEKSRYHNRERSNSYHYKNKSPNESKNDNIEEEKFSIFDSNQNSFQIDREDNNNNIKQNENKIQPDLKPSGALTQSTKLDNKFLPKWTTPNDAAIPNKGWVLYEFRGGKNTFTIKLENKDVFCFGSKPIPDVVDIFDYDQSVSKQHAVIQFRKVWNEKENKDKITPYLLDLESKNKTFLNGSEIPPRKYISLLTNDVIRFGISHNDYVLTYENEI